MAFMGYETPVEMPSMGVYNTDLMKMYIAGVKEQYEQAREEMKDFMKLYLDFYSPVDGATEAYNLLTIGGAGDLISKMFANGIDPYKSPEARAIIGLYIASRPTGLLKQLELQKEDYTKYQDAVRTAMANGTLNPLMEDFYLQKEGLKDFKAVNPDGSVNKWTRLAPSKFTSLESITNPFFKDLEKTDYAGADPNHPGYSLYKIKDDVLGSALQGGVKAVHDHPQGDFFVYLAEQKLKNAGIDRTTNPNDFDQLLEAQLALDVKNANSQAWQTKSDWDKWGAEQRGYRHAERMESIRHSNAMIEKGHVPNSPSGGLSITNNLVMAGNKMTTDKTGTMNIAKGQELLLSNYLTKHGANVMSPQTTRAGNAKSFLDYAFLQQFSSNAAAKLASGKNVKGDNIYYRPGRDGARVKTYNEVANNLQYGQLGNTPFAFGGPFSITSDSITNYLDKQYDESDPQKVQIIFDGGAYSVLENDGAYHTYTQATALVYGKPDSTTKQRPVIRKERIPYEITASFDAKTGNMNASQLAEAPFTDQFTTKGYGIGMNTGNKTVGL